MNLNRDASDYVNIGLSSEEMSLVSACLIECVLGGLLEDEEFYLRTGHQKTFAKQLLDEWMAKSRIASASTKG